MAETKLSHIAADGKLRYYDWELLPVHQPPIAGHPPAGARQAA
ncbi:hypothetical protein [Chloracidobacterium thermophilum]|nr:hypothetical protein [Chloracidobacterium thermophilum]